MKEDFDAVLDDVEDNCSDKLKTQRGKWSCVVRNAKAETCWQIRRHMGRMHDLNNKDLKPCRVCKKVMVYDECFHDKGENVKNLLAIFVKKYSPQNSSCRFTKNLILPNKNFRAVYAVRNSNLSDM